MLSDALVILAIVGGDVTSELPCGPKALLRAAGYLDVPVSSAEVLEVCGEHPTHTIATLSTAARQLRLIPKVVVLNPWEGPFPPDLLIAWLDHVPGGHFVLIRQEKDGQWKLWDRDETPQTVSREWLARRWPGPAIQLTKSPPGRFSLPLLIMTISVGLVFVALAVCRCRNA